MSAADQRRFDFGRHRKLKSAVAEPQWPEIISSDPGLYPGILQSLAAMALHRQDKPHEPGLCPLCERARFAA
jgi:hypothetical protein